MDSGLLIPAKVLVQSILEVHLLAAVLMHAKSQGAAVGAQRLL